MALDTQEIMRMMFLIIYLIYICFIVIFMSKNMRKVEEAELKTAKRIRWAFALLLIGDFGHSGTRLIAIFSGDLENNYALLGIGSLLGMIGVIFLFLFYTDAWRVHFNHPKNLLYKLLIGVGIVGLIIIIFPQNQWTAQEIPYDWLIIRNTPWLIQGVAVAILIYKDAKAIDDKLLKWSGIFILASFFCYMPVIYFGHLEPMLGMLMIVGTIFYMLWQYASYRRFFMKKK